MQSILNFPLAHYQDHDLAWAVIVSRFQGQWLMVRHKDRQTFEPPGGRREQGEGIEDCARRELHEETGAIEFDLEFVTAYEISIAEHERSRGALYFARIQSLGDLPESEIAEVHLFDQLPQMLTYPQITPLLFEYIQQRFGI